MTDDTALPATPVQAVRATAYTVPTDAPSADGTLEWDKTTMVVVTVEAAGKAGLGWTYSASAAAALVQTVLADVVVGRDVANVPAINEALYRAVRNFGRGGFTSYGERQLRDQLTSWVTELRIRRVKIKIGESWGQHEGRDLARIAQAREIVGPEAELYVDSNGGYTRPQAARVAAEMAHSGVCWFEEPVSSDHVVGLAALRAALAADRGLQVSAPNLHARVGAGVANLRHVEYFHDHQRIERMLFDGALSAAGGVMTPDSGRPGIGMELRAADAAKFLSGA